MVGRPVGGGQGPKAGLFGSFGVAVGDRCLSSAAQATGQGRPGGARRAQDTMRYPTRLLTDGEQILHQFRPHWRVLLPALGWAMALAAVAGFAVAALDAPWRTYAAGAAVLVWLLLSTRSILDWWFTNYVLTTERIIVRAGMIARTGTEIPLESINNVLFTQRVTERLLRYGDVLIESAGSQGQSHLHDIPDPEAFQSEVYRARELRSLHFRGARIERPGDVVERLEVLADLRERGHLDDDEFAQQKARLLRQVPEVERPALEAMLDEDELDPDR
jgi:membrane protein YdbS with pleckstrin-like domain